MANIYRSTIAGIVLSLFLVMIFVGISIAQDYNYAKSSIYFRNKCSNILIEPDCGLASCYWFDDSCHPIPQYLPEPVGQTCKIIYEASDMYICTKTNGAYMFVLK